MAQLLVVRVRYVAQGSKIGSVSRHGTSNAAVRRPADTGRLVARLRAAGCVFAEEEAAALVRSAPDPEHLEAMARRREAGEPLEHVVGWVDLGGLRLAVGPGVFVPRQRSLLLARAAAAVARTQEVAVVVEAYAGVAPIAAWVARAVLGAEVHATDADPRALRFARRNLPPGSGVHPGQVLEALPAALLGRVTLLVAVPPYVPAGAAGQLPREAVEHEPAAALFGGHDGLGPVRELVGSARPWLAPAGVVLVELHAAQHPAAAAHARRAGFVAGRRVGDDGQTTLLELRLPHPGATVEGR
jgi:release factor glutamine methyltransferase